MVGNVVWIFHHNISFSCACSIQISKRSNTRVLHAIVCLSKLYFENISTVYEAFKHFDMWKAHGTEGFLFTWGNFHKPSNIHVFRHFDLSCFCCQYSPIQINVSSSIKRKDAAYLGWEGRWVSSYRCFLCQSNLSKL